MEQAPASPPPPEEQQAAAESDCPPNDAPGSVYRVRLTDSGEIGAVALQSGEEWVDATEQTMVDEIVRAKQDGAAPVKVEILGSAKGGMGALKKAANTYHQIGADVGVDVD